jgi:dihydroorotate dehydrogenase electron transfer subunit
LLACQQKRVSFLYRIVGRGTAMLAEAPAGSVLSFFGPLGSSFPEPDDTPTLLIAGGCGLPPLYAWRERYGRSEDGAFFGARDGSEVPWRLLDASWRISVDRPEKMPSDRQAYTGLVVAHCRARLSELEGKSWTVLSCGPRPMLQAVVSLAREQGWKCIVSVEEHMGCGYGVCRGCVIPSSGGKHLTACQDGPVLPAERIDWDRFTEASPLAPPSATACRGDAGN